MLPRKIISATLYKFQRFYISTVITVEEEYTYLNFKGDKTLVKQLGRTWQRVYIVIADDVTCNVTRKLTLQIAHQLRVTWRFAKLFYLIGGDKFKYLVSLLVIWLVFLWVLFSRNRIQRKAIYIKMFSNYVAVMYWCYFTYGCSS